MAYVLRLLSQLFILLVFGGSLINKKPANIVTSRKVNISQQNLSPMKGHVNLRNCEEDINLAKRLPFTTRHGLTLSPIWSDTEEYEKNPYSLLNFRWTYRATKTNVDPNTFETGNLTEPFDITPYQVTYIFFEKIHFPPFAIKPALYTLTFKVDLISSIMENVFQDLKERTCHFYIYALPLVAVIDGGLQRHISDAQDTEISGKLSIDPNVPESKYAEDLKFYWNCRQKITHGTICSSPLPNKATFTIPSQKLLVGDVIYVNLKIQNVYGNWGYTNQTIHVGSNSASLGIRCKKNCRPMTIRPSTKKSTVFSANCFSNCYDIKPIFYQWTIEAVNDKDFSFDYKKNALTNRNGQKFVIKGNVLKAGVLYKLTLRLSRRAKRFGQAISSLSFKNPPLVTSCAIDPPAGRILRTLFTLKCEDVEKNKNHFYELYSGNTETADSDGDTIISGFYPEIFDIHFLLPLSQEHSFYVKVSYAVFSLDPSPFLILPVEPEVFDYLYYDDENSISNDIIHIYNKFYFGASEKISELLTSENKQKRKKGVEKFHDLVEMIVGIKVVKQDENEDARKTFVKDVTYKIVQAIINSPFHHDVSDLVKLSDDIFKLILRHQLTQLDPYLAKLALKICKMMVDASEKKIENRKDGQNLTDEADNVFRTMSKCAEITIPKEDVWHNITITVFPPVKLDVAVADDYVDYVDDNDFDVKHHHYNDIVKNIVSTTAKAAKNLALTMTEGDAVRRTGEFSTTLVVKDESSKLTTTRIKLFDVVLIPSQDFANNTHDMDILMTIWTQDLYWWNQKKTSIASSLLNVQFWHSKCRKRIKHFKNPANITFGFDDSAKFVPKIFNKSIIIPENYLNLDDSEINKYISVMKIDFPKNSILFLDFLNISGSDIFDVVFIQLEYPTIHHFKNCQTLTNGQLFNKKIINSFNYDIWFYVGILPNKDFVKRTNSKTLQFHVKFILSFCIHWSNEDLQWKQDCKPRESTNHYAVDCNCRHFSALAGYLQNAHFVVSEVQSVEIEMEFQVYYVIFTTLAVTFAIYTLLILFALLRKRNEIYFLADNCEDHLYAYLIAVRTENYTGSGTTSKVTFRLIGNKKSSEPHVLNYPDPKLHILQKGNTDIFVLTTKGHLGKIKKIEMWFDCTGPSTSWYCRDILVCDLQTRSEWYFRIRTRFALSRYGIHYLQMPPRDKEPPGICNQFQVCNQFHTWQLWLEGADSHYFGRLTTILSNILMTYCLVLVYLGIPSFEMKDCFDSREVYTINRNDVGFAFFCSFISFLIHVAISWFYRFSDLSFSVHGKKFKLNHTYSWACWILLVNMIIIESSFLMLFGFFVPTTSSYVWLTCCLFGLLVDALLYENIFIIIQTFFCKFRLLFTIENKFDAIVRNIEAQRNWLYTKFDVDLLRPFLQHLYKPMPKIDKIKRSITVRLRHTILNDLQDLVMYVFYYILLYILVTLYRGTLIIETKEEIESLINGEHTRTLSVSDVNEFKNIYEYINSTLIPVMHSYHESESYEGLMIDAANKFIGVARIRQHRSIANYCRIPEIMSFTNFRSCWPELTRLTYETDSFNERWSKNLTGMHQNNYSSMWKYSTGADTETWSTGGFITNYNGGGYVTFLGRTFKDSFQILNRLIQWNWIDKNTRCVFIEFLTYNANINVFVAVTLLFEQSAAGIIYSDTYVDVIKMLFVENEKEIGTFACFVIFVIWYAMMIIKLSLGIYKYLTEFYKKVWIMIDLIIDIITMVCIILFTTRINMVRVYLGELEKFHEEEFISYFDLLHIENYLTYFNGILICITTARLWRFLRFNLFFRIMERTLSMAAFPLLGVTLNFAIILICFGLSGIIIFRGEFEELGSFKQILVTLICLSLKPDQFDLTQFVALPLAYYYFTLYLVFMQVFLLIYVTVVIMAYVKAQLELSAAPDSYTVFDYLGEQKKYLPMLIRSKICRLTAGETEKSPVTPKADEFRYANSVGIRKSKLNSMAFITSCVVRNMGQTVLQRRELIAIEVKMMLNVIRIFVLRAFDNDHPELFFKGHFEKQKIQLIDEKKIDKIANFVKLMFQKDDEYEKPTSSEVDLNKQKMIGMVLGQNRNLYKCKMVLKLANLRLEALETRFDNIID